MSEVTGGRGMMMMDTRLWTGCGVLMGRMGPWACPRHLSCSELTEHLGENPGGILGTTQANPCCC